MTIKVTYNVTDVYMSQSVSPVYITVSYSDGGASGGGVWGSITGTLSNQTDLQTALDLKLDESTIDGGTEGQILSKASATNYDFAWINNYAKYLATNVRNQTGSTIGAFQVVYISGATGNKPLVSLADADTEATSTKTYGVTATSIANNGTGDVVTAGELSGIDTSAYNEGDLLWLSTTAGGVVTSPPAEPAHAVFIGYVVRSHPTLGVIDVAIANGYELNELHGVQITTPTDNQGLFYNATSTLWENKSITTALGYTPVPTTRNITINGVTYDLSADRTYTISTGISGSGASGQVTYWTGASAVSGSNNLFWDNANGRLGIGTNAPATLLDIYSSVNSNSSLQVGASQNVRISINTQSANRFGILSISRIGDGATPCISIGVGTGPTSSSGIISTNNDNLIFGYNVGNTFTETFRINTLNRLLLGFTTDQAVKLAVNGDTLLRGSGNTSATTALTVQNSSSTNLLVVRNDGNVGIGTNTPSEELTVVGTIRSNAKSGADNVFLEGYNSAGTFIAQLKEASSGGFGGLQFNGQRNDATGGAGIFFNSFVGTTASGNNAAVQFNANGGIITSAADLPTGIPIAIFSKRSGGVIVNQMALFQTGNLLIQNGGTFTDNGQRLQVYGDTLLRGSGATSATTALTVQNSSSTNLFSVRNDGVAEISSNGGRLRLNQNTGGVIFNGIDFTTSGTVYASFIGNQSTGEIRLHTVSSYFPTFYSSGAEAMRISTSRNLLIGTVTDIASSILTINSTTQGFLPPRMTTTQKNAIATPAAGLVVYDTTLNKLCVYTTAWETITSI